MAAALPKFKSAHMPSERVQLVCPEVGRTKQAMRDECDINNILARYQKTGVLEFVNKHEAQYGDVSGIDFQNAMNLVAEQKERFAQLPSRVRNHFENDPAAFLEFVADPANTDEAIKLGLLEAAKPSTEAKPEVAPGAQEELGPAQPEQ